jgi:kynurenine formamidase
VTRLVDLTQEIYVGMPVYPGHLKTVIWEHASHEETKPIFEGGFSFQSLGLLLSDHGPTHVDAVSHFDPSVDAATMGDMALENFYGPATCIDVSGAAPRTDISVEDVERSVSASGVPVEEGDVLLFRTGVEAELGGTPAYTREYPGLAAEVGDWLSERKVRAFGVDTPSPDNPASSTYPIHMMSRRTGITHYENLANLDQVVGRRFTFIGFPLRIRGGSGSPVRAVAVVE